MKKLKLSSLRVDLDRQYKGDWISYPLWDGVRFNVSSPKLPAYQRCLAKNQRDIAKRYPIGQDQLPTEEALEANREAEALLVCEHLLHGWEGIDLEYSPDAAEKYLIDPEYEALLNAVKWCGNKLAEVNAEYIEDLAKNSDAPSATG